MPVTSPAISLTEIFAHVWNRERRRVERATRLSCLLVAKEPGGRKLSKSDRENLMAVGRGEQPLDVLNPDLRFPGEFWREYDAAVKEDWLKESRELKCSRDTPTSWVVACKVFGRWARKCVPGFHHDDLEVRINLQDHYRWLDTRSGAPDGQVQAAFVTLEETEIHEDLLRQQWEECAAESQEMGLPKADAVAGPFAPDETATGANQPGNTPKLKLPKAPSKEANQAYTACKVNGLTQSTVAKRMNTNQGQVSRYVNEVEAFLVAGGVLVPLTSNRPKVIPIDPAILDMGERTDPRTPKASDLHTE